MGKAHGKIVIDTDKKGADDAANALASLAATAKNVERSLKGLEKQLGSLERDLAKVAAASAVADAGLGKLDTGFDKVGKSSSRASKGTKDFDIDLGKVIQTVLRAKNAYESLIGPLVSVRDVMSAIRGIGTDLVDGNLGAKSFGRLFGKTMLVSSGLRLLRDRFLKVDEAMQAMPSWTHKLTNFASKVGIAAALIAGFQRISGRLFGTLNKFSGFRLFGDKAFAGIHKIIGAAYQGQGALSKLALGLVRTTIGVEKLGKAGITATKMLSTLTNPLFTGVTGFAVAKLGATKLIKMVTSIGKIPKIAMAGLYAMPAAVQAAGKSLIFLSNLLNGAWGAVKTLSGGLLAVPGFFATIGFAVVPLMGIFKTLGSVMKDALGAKTPEELAEAMAKVPEAFRPLTKSVVAARDVFKDLGKQMAEIFSGGLAEQIDGTVANFKGPLTNGARGLAQAYKGVKDSLFSFLNSRDTVAAFNLGVYATKGTIENLGKALVPVMNGFRDIGVVGMQFIRDMTAGAEGLSQRFANWANTNRQNGNLRKWMDDARAGMTDLISGSKNLVKALWSILTMFSTNSGDNALDRFAKSMEKFNNAVENSKASGMLKNIADAVKGVGTDKIEALVETLKRLMEFRGAVKSLLDAIQEISDAVVNSFVAALNFLLPMLEWTIEKLGMFAPIIGVILGVGAAFKVLLLITAPVRAAIMAVGGAMLFLKSITGGLSALWVVFVTLVGQMGTVGAMAARGLSALAASLVACSTAIMGIAALGVGIWLVWREGTKQLEEFRQASDDAAKHAKENVKQLQEAFAADKGLPGKTVFSQVKSDMDEMLTDLENKTKSAPGLLGKFVDAFKAETDDSKPETKRSRVAGAATDSHTDEYNELEKGRIEAEKAQKAFEALKLTSDDLAKATSGTDAEFARLTNRLKLTGDNSDAAIKRVQDYRNIFKEIEQASAAAGPGTFEIASAIDELANSSSNATERLSALKAALKALGQDSTEDTRNAFAYAETIEKIAESTNLFNASGDLGTALLGDSGGFNKANDNAEILFENIVSLVDGFQKAAIKAGNTKTAFEEMAPAIANLATQAQLSEKEITGLMSRYGGNAAVIDVLLKVKAGNDIGKDLAVIQAQILSNPNGKFSVDIKGNPQSAIDDITKTIPGAIAKFNETTGLLEVDLAPANPEDVKNFAEAVKEGAEQALQASPVEIPIAKVAEGPKQQEFENNIKGAFAATQKAPDPVAVPDTSKLDDANNKIKTTSEALDQLNGKQVNIGGNIGDAAGQLGSLADAASKAATSFNTFAQGVQTSVNQAVSAVQNMVAQINATLGNVAASAQSYGVMVGNAFAAGLSSMQGVVALAARNIAQAVNDNLKPGSPTKKGPLSGSGWVGVSGKKTGQAYGDALAGTAGYVSKATGKVAGGVSSGLSGGTPFDIGKALGRLQDIVGFGQHLVEIFKKVGDNIFKTMKFISDPLGKGTFFGKKLAFGRDKNVSDVTLQKQKEDKLQEQLSSAVASGVKDEVKDQRAADAKTAKDQKAAAEGQLSAADSQKATARTAAKTVEDTPRPTDLQENINQTLAQRDAQAADPTKTKQNVDQKAIDLSAPENASQRKQGADLSNLSKEELAEIAANTNLTAKSQDEIISELRSQDSNLDSAIRVLKDGNASTEATIAAANTLDSTIQSQKDQDTPASRATAKSLESIQSSGTGDKGIARQANPIDTAAGIASDVGNIAGEVFTSIESVLESVGAAKDLGDTLVRGIENSEDVMKIIDNVQKFVETAANIASAVGSGLGAAAGIASIAGSDPTGAGGAAAGALGGASEIASLISAGLSTVNGIIDLAQEAYGIAGKYVGDFLGMLVGGAGGALEGDVKFLLDQNDGTLKTYSKDNPEDKRVFGNPFDRRSNVVGQQPQIGQINVYGGPGQDPRDMTNEMMFAVAAAGSGAGNYN